MRSKSINFIFSAILLSLLFFTSKSVAQSSQPTTQPSSRATSLPASKNEKALKGSKLESKEKRARQEEGLPQSSNQSFVGLDHEGTPALPPKENSLPPESTKSGEKRSLPQYRPKNETSAGEGLVWIPRVLFYPVHLTLEYLVRWPIVKTMTFAEEHFLIERVQRFFTFNEGKGGLFPTLLFDFGVKPAMGLYFYYDEFLAKNNDLVLQAGYWPTGWYHFVIDDKIKIFRDDSGILNLRGEYVNRPDFVFNGMGPLVNPKERYYRYEEFRVETSLRAILSGLNRVNFGVSYLYGKISNGQFPSVLEDQGEFCPLPIYQEWIRTTNLFHRS